MGGIANMLQTRRTKPSITFSNILDQFDVIHSVDIVLLVSSESTLTVVASLHSNPSQIDLSQFCVNSSETGAMCFGTMVKSQ